MRFDDRLTTVLGSRPDTDPGRVAQWRQLLDILAQRGDAIVTDAALERLSELRRYVTVPMRAQAVAALVGRPLSPSLLGAIADDQLSVAAPLLSATNLPEAAWLELLPQLPAGARALLRERRDLGPVVQRALAALGRVGLAATADEQMLGDNPAATFGQEVVAENSDSEAQATSDDRMAFDQPEVADGGTQIRDLLQRIESFKRDRPAPLAEAPLAPADGFAFEADADGLIVWVEGIGREALVGLTIARPAEPGEGGVDGQAAGAFRRRAPFRSARLLVSGNGEAGGDWRISAVPFFDQGSGRFLGFRGSARRPRRDETAGDGAHGDALLAGGLAPDSLRQLIHELRTPLNAIQGFADMIDGQMLGPAAQGYRQRAGEIGRQSRRLLGAVEDLDLAAQISGDRLSGESGGGSDGTALLCRLHAEHLPLAREGDVDLRFTLAKSLPDADVDLATAERMFSRLIAAAIGLATRGETIAIAYDREPTGHLRLSVSRPIALAGQGAAALLDPGYTPDGEWPGAPTLGLGFALRLVGNLARAKRGRFTIEPRQFVLDLPALAVAGESGRRSG